VFGARSVGYLGRLISKSGVAMDTSKVRVVTDWLMPKTVRAVRAFLVLIGYYR
jgi:hypothetical protein